MMREPQDERGRRRVRPYAVTRGRTRPSGEDLELEALVSTTVLGEAARSLSPERHSIALLCRDVLSIAEISARLSLPLGVARVLVGDMADEGLVQVHRPNQVGDRPDIVLLERVLYGLRAI
jgi:hypothetical protein